MAKIESKITIAIGALVAAVSVIVHLSTEKNFIAFALVGFGMMIYGIYSVAIGDKKPKKARKNTAPGEIVRKIPGANYKFNPNVFFCVSCGKELKTGTKQCPHCRNATSVR